MRGSVLGRRPTVRAVAVGLCALSAALCFGPSAAGRASQLLTSPESQVEVGRVAAFVGESGWPIGFELKPFGAEQQPASEVPERLTRYPLPQNTASGRFARSPLTPPPIPQPGQPIRPSLDTFVRENPGYEWVADGPLLSVRPVGALADQTNWLNAPVPSFEVRDLTMAETMTSFGRVFDPAYDPSRVVVGRAIPSSMRPPTRPQAAVDGAQAKRFSVRVENTTVRGALNAIVLAHGAAGWLVCFTGAAPARATARLEIVFWSGTSVIAYTVTPPPQPAAEATRPILAPLPLTLRTMRFALIGLAAKESAVLGFVVDHECQLSEPSGMLNLSGLGLSEAVKLVLAHCPGYEAQTINGVTTVAPPGTVDRDRILGIRLRRFSVANVTAFEALYALALPDVPPRPGSRPTSPNPAVRDAMNKPLTVKLDRTTVREGLNAIAAAHGALAWVFEPSFAGGQGRFSLEGLGWSVSVTASRLLR